MRPLWNGSLCPRRLAGAGLCPPFGSGWGEAWNQAYLGHQDYTLGWDVFLKEHERADPRRKGNGCRGSKIPYPLAKLPGCIISINIFVCLFELHYMDMFPSAILQYSIAGLIFGNKWYHNILFHNLLFSI